MTMWSISTLSLLSLQLCMVQLLLPTSLAYSINHNENQSRGKFFKTLVKSSIAAAATTTIINPSISNAAVSDKPEGKILRAGNCAYGVGDGCADLSEGNDFIKELQKKSAQSKESAQKEYLSAYQMKNYPDFFASLSPPKFMVKLPDGTFKLYEEEELSNLKKEGKIKLEKPKAMGGQVADITQKPILVLVE